MRVRPAWGALLYALLGASAVVALWSQRAADAPPAVAQVAPWLFLGFVVGFAIYRSALVAVRRYSPFKAFVQVSIAALFFMLLLLPNVQVRPSGEGGQPLLQHGDARVRANAAEVLGYRHAVDSAPEVRALLADPVVEVREVAHEALVRLNDGVDLGPAGDPAALARWKERFP